MSPRKTAEGHSKLEIIRCIKRYLAREIYHLMREPTTLPRATWLLGKHPRQRIQLRRLRGCVRAAGPAPFDAPDGIVPGQRGGRELVRLPQGGVGRPASRRTRAEARAAIFAWIHYYNQQRLHSTNGYLPPVEWEQQHAAISPLASTTAA